MYVSSQLIQQIGMRYIRFFSNVLYEAVGKLVDKTLLPGCKGIKDKQL